MTCLRMENNQICIVTTFCQILISTIIYYSHRTVKRLGVLILLRSLKLNCPNWENLYISGEAGGKMSVSGRDEWKNSSAHISVTHNDVHTFNHLLVGNNKRLDNVDYFLRGFFIVRMKIKSHRMSLSTMTRK